MKGDEKQSQKVTGLFASAEQCAQLFATVLVVDASGLE